MSDAEYRRALWLALGTAFLLGFAFALLIVNLST